MVHRRILIVEDEYFIATDIVRSLEQVGAKAVGPVASVADAMKLVEKRGVDAAILDINLHDTPVYPLAAVLEREHVPFVFATGYGEHAIPERFKSVPRFEKPLDLDRLVKAVIGS